MDTSTFYNTLLEKGLSGSIDNLVRSAAELINQGVVLLDPSYKVIAQWPHEKIGDRYWDAQQEYGYVPEENLQRIFENNYPRATLDGPAYLAEADMSCPRCAVSIQHDGMLLAHLSVYHIDPTLKAEELIQVSTRLEHIFKVFLLNNNQLSTVSTTVMSALISRLFTGHHVNQEFLDEWQKICGSSLLGGFVIAAFSPQKLHKSIMGPLSSRMSNIHQYVVFAELENFSYILFYNIHSQHHLQSIIMRLDDYLCSYKLHCGLSELFYNIEEIPIYLYQSRKALKTGHEIAGDKLLHSFGELRADIMLSYVCENMEAENCVHPLFAQLKNEDKQNGTQYFQTLCAYLDCMCDSAKAANLLFIHRNTLLYRIKHIEEKYSISMNDEQLMKDLLLSHMVCSFRASSSACENAQNTPL